MSVGSSMRRSLAGGRDKPDNYRPLSTVLRLARDGKPGLAYPKGPPTAGLSLRARNELLGLVRRNKARMEALLFDLLPPERQLDLLRGQAV